jgi:hypothetical protein
MKITPITKFELAERRLNGKLKEPYSYTKKEITQKPFLLLLLEVLTGGQK